MTKKGWKIENGVLPDDLIAELTEYLAATETVFTRGETHRPPWTEFPDYIRTSMGWRMGSGEDYMLDFKEWFTAQGAQEQSQYKQSNPEPDGWEGFYDYIQGK